jgi:hypothetical protein
MRLPTETSQRTAAAIVESMVWAATAAKACGVVREIWKNCDRKHNLMHNIPSGMKRFSHFGCTNTNIDSDEEEKFHCNAKLRIFASVRKKQGYEEHR